MHSDDNKYWFTNRTSVQGWPTFEQMEWSHDCLAWADFFGATIYVQDRFNKSNPLGFNLQLGINWVVASLPERFNLSGSIDRPPEFANLNQTEKDNYLRSAIVTLAGRYINDALYAPWVQGKFYGQYVLGTASKCPKEACMATGMSGNQDMTGIGVMVSYYMGAALATLYLVCFTVRQFKHWDQQRRLRAGKPQRPTNFAVQRMIDAFRGTLKEFLITANLLSLVMIVAGIFVVSEKIEDKEKPEYRRDLGVGSYNYDIALALLACVFAVFPVLVGNALMRHPDHGQSGSRKKWFGRCVLVLIWILGAVMVYLVPLGDPNFETLSAEEEQKYKDIGIPDDFLAWCDVLSGNAYPNGLLAAKGIVIGAPLLWALITVFLRTGFRIPGVAGSPWLRSSADWWRLGIAWFNLLAGWAILAYLQYIRQRLRNLSGRLGEDGKWTFGQILAVSLWFPVMCEFIYVLVFGLRDSLSGSLPPEYTAVLREDCPNYSQANLTNLEYGYGYGAPGHQMEPEEKQRMGNLAGSPPLDKSTSAAQINAVSEFPSRAETMHDPYFSSVGATTQVPPPAATQMSPALNQSPAPRQARPGSGGFTPPQRQHSGDPLMAPYTAYEPQQLSAQQMAQLEAFYQQQRKQH